MSTLPLTLLSILIIIVGLSSAQTFDMLSAPWTPFVSASNQSINYGAIQCLHQLHVKNGVHTVWLGGNMAQWTSMTTEERLQLFATWVTANRNSASKLRILPQVGSSILEQACTLAREATRRFSNDIAGIAVIGPAYLDKPATVDVLVDWIRRVDTCQVGNPKLPIYYYHIPQNTGITVKMAEFVRKAKAAGITIGGIKFVDDDVLDFFNASTFLGPSGNVYFANVPKLRSMPFGATKFVLAENFMAPYMNKIASNFVANNMAEAVNWEIKYGQVMNAIGLGNGRSVDGMLDPACDNGPPRLPLTGISPQQRAAEFQALTDIGFFDFVKSTWKNNNDNINNVQEQRK